MSENWVLGFIGAGNMGSALIRGVIEAGLLSADRIRIADVDARKTSSLAKHLGVGVAANNTDLLAQADTIVLAVKPQGMIAVLSEIAPGASERHLFVSIAAGVPIRKFEEALGGSARVVRVMPNTPSMIGCGAAGLARGTHATPADMERALSVFRSVGCAVEVEESQLDAVTGLSGSGPAYVFHMIEALTDAGEKAGLSREVATVLTHQTVLGAARMVVETGVEPAELRRRVTSPNGTTEAGLKILSEGGFLDLVGRTVARAAERSRELAKLAG
ncbi:pyrroline-5-carboxylate reductase [Candidatus Sumerlaeota bacterium]|nr:pyrroline-5-carboxylate reductase [Candidatus Sumerlaeota bacterium]